MKRLLLLCALACTISVIGCVADKGNVNDNVPHTTISGKIMGQPFAIQNPKDTVLDGLSINATTNTASISIAHLSTLMNPANTAATGEAGEKLVAAQGKANVDLLNAFKDGVKELAPVVGATVHAAATGVP